MANAIDYSLLKAAETNPLYVSECGNQTQEAHLQLLGKGGSKVAYQWKDTSYALILPNTDADPLPEIAERWDRVVEQEIDMSLILTQVGLFSLDLKKVDVSAEKDGRSIPGYLATSFSALAKKEIYVLDSKNKDSSTWRGKLFQSEAEALNVNEWRRVCSMLIDDVVKLALNDIPTPYDSLNLIVQRISNSYQVRHLGFDYTNKTGRIQIPKPYNQLRPCEKITRLSSYGLSVIANTLGVTNKIRNLFEQYLGLLFYYEFRKEGQVFSTDMPPEAELLLERLINEFTRKVFRIIFLYS